MKNFQTDLDFALKSDSKDKLIGLTESFNFPLNHPIYLCGHSLGLQPKQTEEYVKNVIDDWAKLGVKGHLSGNSPWFDFHTFLTLAMSKIVGAKKSEIVVMNSLTTNLHLLMISFFNLFKKAL